MEIFRWEFGEGRVELNLQEDWEDLANAIILQAVEDYRRARRIIRKRPDHQGAWKIIRETERFMKSRWFAQLTDIDGETLLRKLKEEVAR